MGNQVPRAAWRILHDGIRFPRGAREGGRDHPSVGRVPRARAFLRLQPFRAGPAVRERGRVHPHARGHRLKGRQPAAGRGAGRRRAHPADHGRAPSPDRRMACGERRGDLRDARTVSRREKRWRHGGLHREGRCALCHPDRAALRGSPRQGHFGGEGRGTARRGREGGVARGRQRSCRDGSRHHAAQGSPCVDLQGFRRSAAEASGACRSCRTGSFAAARRRGRRCAEACRSVHRH